MRIRLPLRSVRGRLLLVAVLVEALMLTLLVANSLRLLNTHMGAQARNHAEQITPVLLAAIVAPLAQRDYATVQAVLDESRAVPGIDYLVITDTTGRRLIASGWAAEDPLPAVSAAPGASEVRQGLLRQDLRVPINVYGQPMGELHLGLDLSRIVAAHTALFQQGVAIALLEIVISAGLMSLLGFFLTRHLGDLRQASEAVAAGNLTPAPIPEGEDEIGRLGAAFNAMSRAVSERVQELTLARDEAKQLAEAAQAAARAKSTFLATMSHEIRTPMNGVLGMADLALATELTDEQREYLNWVKSSGESLLHILNDILDFSKIEAGQMALEKLPFDLAEVLDSIVGIYSMMAREKGLALSWRADSPLPARVLSDPVRLRQIVSNLVSNALKFTASGHVEIRISTRSTADAIETTEASECTLCLAVYDTGIGIPEEKRELIFSPFLQAEAFITRQYGGTGLGLSIVRQLVELLGGRVWVESEAGQGSCFRVEVPVGIAPAELQDVPAACAAAPQTLRPGHVILLVEDTPVNVLLARRILDKQGYQVCTAANGQEAVDQYRQQAFDLVLMDMQMPVLDGLGATAQIRTHEQDQGLRRTPIIALTANALPSDRSACLAAGMDDFISKPFRADDMLAVIQRHLAQPLV